MPKLVESDEHKANELAETLTSTVVIHGSPTDTRLLSEENASEMNTFVACDDREETNLMAALLGKEMGAKRIIVTTNERIPTPHQECGRRRLSLPAHGGGQLNPHFIRRGRVVAVQALGDGEAAEALEFEAQLASDAVNVPLKELKLPRGALIAALVREDSVLIPSGDTVIKEGDHVVVLAPRMPYTPWSVFCKDALIENNNIEQLASRLGMLANLVGILMLALGVAMIPSVLVADHDGTQDYFGLLAASLIAIFMGLVFFLTSRRAAKRTRIGHREGFLIVGVGWFAAGLIGALPFYLYPHLSPDGICQLAEQLKDQPIPAPAGSDFAHSARLHSSPCPGLRQRVRQPLPRGYGLILAGCPMTTPFFQEGSCYGGL